MRCIYCNKEITKWQTFLGWFWKLPLRISEFSKIWEQCCSYRCYGKQLERLLQSMDLETRETLDLADYLFLSVSKFITLDHLLEHIKEIHTTEWAKHIIAAGYRKTEPNNNPVDKVFTSRDRITDTFTT